MNYNNDVMGCECRLPSTKYCKACQVEVLNLPVPTEIKPNNYIKEFINCPFGCGYISGIYFKQHCKIIHKTNMTTYDIFKLKHK